VQLVEIGRRAQPEVVARPLELDTAIMIVGGLRELLVIALQQGREVRDLDASASATIKAILRGMVLEP
jgi:hypothetical protein